MRVTKIVSKDTEVTSDILCNKCGETCGVKHDFDDESGGDGYWYGLIETKVTGGYYSTHLQDEKFYTFSICEKCLLEMFHNFKIPTYKEEQLRNPIDGG